MSDLPETTLTQIGVTKQAVRFVQSISHAAFTYEGETKEVPIFRAQVEGNIIRVYIFFGDEYQGEISNVKVVDTDGDVIISSGAVHTKAPDRGYYAAFKYKVLEEAVDSVESN